MATPTSPLGDDDHDPEAYVDVLKARGGMSTTNQIAGSVGTHHSTAHTDLEDLEDDGIVTSENMDGPERKWILQTEADGETVPVETVDVVSSIHGRHLRKAGYGTLEDVEGATVADLAAVERISDSTAEALLTAAGSAGPTSLEDLPGVGPTKAEALREAGYDSVPDVQTTAAEDLAVIEGISTPLAERISGN